MDPESPKNEFSREFSADEAETFRKMEERYRACREAFEQLSPLESGALVENIYRHVVNGLSAIFEISIYLEKQGEREVTGMAGRALENMEFYYQLASKDPEFLSRELRQAQGHMPDANQYVESLKGKNI